MDNISTIILAGALFITMLGMGLSLTSNDFKRVLQYPKAILTGLLNQIILLPIIGFALAKIFNLPAEIAIGVMILAACPGGPTSNLITHLAKGDTALSVSLTALSSFITILTIPFIVNFSLEAFIAQGTVIQVNIVRTILQTFVIVIIPCLIGMAIHSKKPLFAKAMGKPVRIFSAVVLLLVIVGIIIKEKSNVLSYFQQAGVVTLALNVATMVIGYITAMLLRLNKKESLTISIESGIQNGTMALTIATVILGNTQYAIAPAIYSLIMFLTGGVVIALAHKTALGKSQGLV